MIINGQSLFGHNVDPEDPLYDNFDKMKDAFDGHLQLLGDENDECEECSPNCSTCFGNSSFCTSCPEGQKLYKGQCIDFCAEDTFEIDDECFDCSENCLTCSGSADTCITCHEGESIYNFVCYNECPNGTYDTLEKECMLCDSSCVTCNIDSNNCTSCPSGTFLFFEDDQGHCLPFRTPELTPAMTPRITPKNCYPSRTRLKSFFKLV